jgi:hypothetical protein
MPINMTGSPSIYYIQCGDEGDGTDITLGKIEMSENIANLRVRFNKMTLDPRRNIIYFIPTHMKLNETPGKEYDYSIWYIDLASSTFLKEPVPSWDDRVTLCDGSYSFIDDKIYFMPYSTGSTQPSPVLNCKTKQMEYIWSAVIWGVQTRAILAPNGDIWGISGVQSSTTDDWCVFTSLQKQDFDITMTISPLGSNS